MLRFEDIHHQHSHHATRIPRNSSDAARMPHRRGYSRKTRSESSQSSADKRSYPQIIREIHGLTGHMGVRSIIPADAVGAFQALACEPNLPPEIGPRNLGQLAASRLMIVLDTAMKIHNRRPASDFSDIWGPAVNELDKKIKLSPGKVSAVMNALAVARTLYLASPPPGNPAECFGPFLGALDKWITIQDKLGASAGESSETKAPNAKRHKNKGRKSKGSQPKEAQPNEGHETQGHTTKRKLAQHDEATEEERAKRRRLSPIHFTVQETPSKKHLNKQEEASGPGLLIFTLFSVLLQHKDFVPSHPLHPPIDLSCCSSATNSRHFGRSSLFPSFISVTALFEIILTCVLNRHHKPLPICLPHPGLQAHCRAWRRSRG